MTNVNLRSQEKAFLIENVKRLMDDIDYPSTSTFRHTTLMVVKSFARGRKMPFQPIIPELISYSSKSQKPEAKWFFSWQKKLKTSYVEKQPSKRKPKPESDRVMPPQLTVELPGFGYLCTSGTTDAIYMGSSRDFYHLFESAYDANSFVLAVIDGLNQIDQSKRITERSGAIPEDYQETALADYESQISIDAWLYRKDDKKEEDNENSN